MSRWFETPDRFSPGKNIFEPWVDFECSIYYNALRYRLDSCRDTLRVWDKEDNSKVFDHASGHFKYKVAYSNSGMSFTILKD